MSDPFEILVSFPIERPAYVGPHASVEGYTRVGYTCGEYILAHTLSCAYSLSCADQDEVHTVSQVNSVKDGIGPVILI